MLSITPYPDFLTVKCAITPKVTIPSYSKEFTVPTKNQIDPTNH